MRVLRINVKNLQKSETKDGRIVSRNPTTSTPRVHLTIFLVTVMTRRLVRRAPSKPNNRA
jgi:hypothetical protein